MRRIRPYSAAEDALIVALYPRLPTSEIGERLDRSRESITCRASKLGVRKLRLGQIPPRPRRALRPAPPIRIAIAPGRSSRGDCGFNWRITEGEQIICTGWIANRGEAERLCRAWLRKRRLIMRPLRPQLGGPPL